MLHTARLHIDNIPSPMKEYYQNQSSYPVVELSIVDALQCATVQQLTQSQLEIWLQHWVEIYHDDVSEIAFNEGKDF